MKKYRMVFLTAVVMAACIGCGGKKEAVVPETETVIETETAMETEIRLKSDTESEKAIEKKEAKKDLKDKDRTEQAMEEERAEEAAEEVQGVEGVQEEEVYIEEPAQDYTYEADDFVYENYGDPEYSGDQGSDACIGDDGDTW